MGVESLSRRSLLSVRAAVGLLVAFAIIAAAALLWWHTERSADADSLPRGALVTLPARPAALDRPAVLSVLNGTRTAAQLPSLTESACLDEAASTAAKGLASSPGGTLGTIPTSACGLTVVASGWATGSDPTGEQQLPATMTRGTSGTSPLADVDAAQAGFALVRQTSHGAVTGYSLVWVTAR
jgi:hypothetical protein